MRTFTASRVAILASLLLGAAPGCGDDELEVTVLYNHANGRVMVELTEALGDGQQMFIQTRRGSFGNLDCRTLVTQIAPVEDVSGTSIDGPVVDNVLTKAFYDGPEWMDPTPEMLAQIALGVDSIIDVCIMDGETMVRGIEMDLFQAWDAARGEGIGGKADDPSGEQRITSPVAYGERCVGELGEIPFFEKQGEGDYSTYNCLESTPIPVTVTAANGSVD
ncbi:MAG: hypothetical protein JWP01_874, partial [Myxococcales bacterium]|nr:hypothetical protein [Myxococcales bacterium]